MPRSKPGVPSLLRELNDSAALRQIMRVGGVTRAELAEHTGLSRVTSSQALARLESLGLVHSQGRRPGARGPAPDLYVLAPRVGAALGMALLPDTVQADLCSLNGDVLASSSVPLSEDIVASCVAAARVVVDEAGVDAGPILAAVVASPGVVDPLTGDLSFSYDLRQARDLRRILAEQLGVPLQLANDVHLAALAECREGVARGEEDFVLLWMGRGVGMATVIDGKVRAGSSGAAGEIGYLPVPGVPLPSRVDNLDQGSFQRLVGTPAVEEMARRHGEVLEGPSSHSPGEAFVAELADRISLGVASVGTILDPALVVLTGQTALLAGPDLPAAVARSTSRIAPIHPRIEVSTLGVRGPLIGARLEAVDTARKALLDRITSTDH
ncbi:ROK family transcriptional regulator [Tessaracoccus antarcticus]|uniref:ROK family transcriptional regulator n=1 Tax=Tessaracoccus antarcticus TaxID=2479848 RepID=A0A3M0G5W9_9ACTN|nr:ROK family transcriptional regulator [Tessaracoccus antarcticus]RMB59958.1 ROK family transcriptional regulator [Tessaracoccus antarcticus]